MDDRALQAWLDRAEVFGFEPPLDRDLVTTVHNIFKGMIQCSPDDAETLHRLVAEMEALGAGIDPAEWLDIVMAARSMEPSARIPGTRLWW